MPDLSGLEGLTGRGGDIGAKVEFLRDILPDYIAEDYSYAAALRDLRSNDFRIGTSLFYDVRRQIEGKFSAPGNIANLPLDYFPSENSLAPNPERQDKSYKFIYRGEVFDDDGNLMYTQGFSMQMNSFGSVGEIIELGRQYFAEKYPGAMDNTVKVGVAYGLRKSS